MVPYSGHENNIMLCFLLHINRNNDSNSFIFKFSSFEHRDTNYIGRNILGNRTSSGRGNKIRLQLRLCTYKQAQVVAQLCNKANAVCKFIFQRAVEVLSKSEIIICNAS